VLRTRPRIQGYGILSLVRFIHQLSVFCNSQPQWHIKLICDNEGLITRLRDAIQYTSVFPNDTLVPDWDITNAIISTLQSTRLQPLFDHIKGHQDKHVSFALLPLEAQLNVEADHKAVHHQTLYQRYRPHVPRLQSNLAQLHIGGATINSNYSAAIRNAASEPALRHHIQSKNNWDDATMQTISWKSHRQALNRMKKRHVQLVKLCHDILPTAKTVHRYNPRATSSCILCHHDMEDLDHLLRCDHPDRKPWRSRLYATLREACESFDTRESLIDVLIKGIDAWMHSTVIDPADYPPSLHDLILSQTSIGWRQLFQGRFSTQWIKLQDQYLQANGISNPNTTGTLWVTRMITVIWRQFFTMWEQRNLKVHGHDLATRTKAQRKRLATEFRFLQSKQNEVLQTNRELFIGSTDDDVEIFIETASPKYIQNWLAIWKPVILDSAKAAQAYAISSVPPLTTYFQSLRTSL
jgi:hypothetical protein